MIKFLGGLKMFNLGQKVMSKKTGLPQTGYIYGIVEGKPFSLNLANRGQLQSYNGWNQHYPNWPLKHIYYVMFDIPSRVISYQEYLQSIRANYGPDIPEEQIQAAYNQIPLELAATYPEDDLEVLE